jgi:hypothetical protein
MMKITEMLPSLLIGFSLIVSHIGARYIHLDIDQRKERLFAHPYMRYLYIYCMAFIGVRNLEIAAIITAIYFIFMKFI